MARRRKHLSAEERALWDKVTAGTKPLASKARPAKVEKPKAPVAVKPASKTPDHPKPTAPIPNFRIGQKAGQKSPGGHDLAPSIRDHVAQAPLAMDHKRFGKMKRGRLLPEDRIDLHGMTQAEAHPALMSFIMGASAQGLRLVLVITGKGKLKADHGPIPERHGVLRHQVPHWLHSGALRPFVLQVTEAHLKHGGQGAYYVYLRKTR